MSIWTSVGKAELNTIDRDWHNATIAEPQDPRECWSFDVATAASWHELIRFSAENQADTPDHIDAMMVISIDEARVLIDWLTQAIEDIEARRET